MIFTKTSIKLAGFLNYFDVSPLWFMFCSRGELLGGRWHCVCVTRAFSGSTEHKVVHQGIESFQVRMRSPGSFLGEENPSLH